MWSGLPKNISPRAHDWGQVLMLEGQTCSLRRAFTRAVLVLFLLFISQLNAFDETQS
jgi:hypothetical protein